MASPFEIRTSNVRIEIESATPSDVTGQVDIQFKAKDPRIANFQMILAQYDIGDGYVNMTLLTDITRGDFRIIELNADIPTKGEWTSYLMIWDSGTDISLINRSSIGIKIQGKDDDGVQETAEIWESTIALNLRPLIVKHPLPVEFLKDTTPEIIFQVPISVKPCNLHFELIIADNADLTNPIIHKISTNHIGWQFQDLGGTYRDFLDPGCPSLDALIKGARAKYQIQGGDALALGTWYYGVTILFAVKKIALEDMEELPGDYDFYPENLGFLLSAYEDADGRPINLLDENPEDLTAGPEIYGPILE